MSSPTSPNVTRSTSCASSARAEPGAAACRITDLPAVYETAGGENGLAEGNAGQITDMICCPGLDFCALANARSIPLAQESHHARFAAPERQARSAS
jgi:hypothetical protein